MYDKLNEQCNVLVRAVDKHTGDVLHERVGHNVWTNTGREYSCLLKTQDINGSPYRQDLISYIGLGSGSQPETVNVRALQNPTQWDVTGLWLKRVNNALTTFQDAGGTRTAVRYTCTFGEQDFSSNNDVSYLSECGLFTDGHAETFARHGRDTNIAAAAKQSPVAYHSFDPIPKTSGIELEIIWELRH